MQVQYIGKNKRHRDRLYDTGARWNGPRDVCEIDDDVAAVMVRKHPDVYAAVSYVCEPYQAPTNTGDPDGQNREIDTVQVEIDGDFYPLSKLAKKKLDAYSQEHFGVNLDQRLKQADLAEQVLELLKKSSAEAPEGSESERAGDTQTENGESGEGSEGGDAAESTGENGDA